MSSALFSSRRRVYPHSSHSGTHPPPLTTLVLILSFHALTKCKSCNPFVLIFMQIGGGMGGAAVVFLKKCFKCPANHVNPMHLFNAKTKSASSVVTSSAVAPSSLTTENCQLRTTSKKSRAMAVVGRRSDA